MRAAAILGLGTSPNNLEPFRMRGTEFMLGVPSDGSGLDAILIFGGDGTVHRHLAQLVKRNLPVLVVPCGSGNDFARALALPKFSDSVTAWKLFCEGAGKTRKVDLGTITENTGLAPTTHYFSCVAGVGIDGEIARYANSMPRWLRARGGYALSLPLAMFSFRTPQIQVEMLSGSGVYELRQSGPALVSVFANTPFYGDGMKIAPKAKLDDGLLDVCTVKKVGKLKLAALFPSVYSGRHLTIPEVSYEQTAHARVSTTPVLDVFADGEFVCRTPVEIGLHRKALRVVVSAG